MTEIPNASAPVIVVGVDGSDSSKDALRWAAAQAELTGATLQAVTAWHTPTMIYGPGVLPFPTDFDPEKESRQSLDHIVTETLVDHPAIKCSTVVAEGHPEVALLRAAQDAELLVVGSRGHGAFTGMFLGSVSAHCVAHSPCPVVVVRHSPEPA